MDHRVANLAHRFVARPRYTVDRSAEHRDLVRQQRVVAGSAFGQGHAAIDAEQLGIGAVILQPVEIFVRRLLFHCDDDVVDHVGEALGQRVERFGDDALELGAREVTAGHLR